MMVEELPPEELRPPLTPLMPLPLAELKPPPRPWLLL